MRVRGGRGFGDSIYVRPIAEHFVRQGKPVTVLSDYPAVFDGCGAAINAFHRANGLDVVVAHYVQGKAKAATTQWQDVCASAHVNVPLHFDWRIRNTALLEGLKQKANGRPILLVHGGREPMDRRDGFGLELMPEKRVFDRVLAKLRDCYRVQIGKAQQVYPLKSDINLNGQTTVSDVLDIAAVCDGVVAQCSFAIPLAEALGKPLLAVWSSRAALSATPFIRLTTPQKVLSSPNDSYVVDDWLDADVMHTVRRFRSQAEAGAVARAAATMMGAMHEAETQTKH